MDEPSASTPAERELRELRERAYGRHPDIEGDPVAVARLVELEAARAGVDAPPPQAADATASIDPNPPSTMPPTPAASAAVTMTASTDGAGQSFWRRTGTTRSGRTWLIAGGLVAVLALVYVVVGWAVGPHPVATLQATSGEPDAQVNRRLDWVLDLRVDTTTLRGFEDYRGLEIWAAEDVYGSPCLIVIDPSIDRPLGDECTPPDADLFTDATVLRLTEGEYGEDLPAGSVIRFHHRGDTVDVYLFPANGAAGPLAAMEAD